MTKKSSHCPFYGIDEDICDVGCGYISPSDVSRIVTNCFSSHTACSKYDELLDRNNVARLERLNSSCPTERNNEIVRDRANSGFTRHGMLGFGSAIFSIGLLLLDTSTQYWPWILLIGLIGIGILTYEGFCARCSNLPLVVSVQIPAGFFFLSILSLLALPAYNVIAPPSPTATIVYCMLWILYAILAHSHLQRTQVAVYGLPATIILCALGTILHGVKPIAAATVATALGLVVVGCIYLATALTDSITTDHTTNFGSLRNRI